MLDEWDDLLAKFVKIFPTDYKRVLAELAAQEQANAGEDRFERAISTGGDGFVVEEVEEEEVRSDG